MLRINGCHRCSGTLFFDKDFYGSFLMCLSCGDVTDAPDRRNGHHENGGHQKLQQIELEALMQHPNRQIK